MLGCWCNEEYFLSSTLHSEEDGIVTSVWLCRANSSGNNEQVMNLENSIKALFKFKNNILLFARFLQIYRRKNIIESDSLWSSSALPTVQVMQEDAAEEEEVNLPGNQNQNLSEETHQIIDEQQCLIFICSDKTIVPHQIGNFQLKNQFTTVLDTKWRSYNHLSVEFQQTIRKKIVKACLHLSKILQNSFHFLNTYVHFFSILYYRQTPS